MSIKFVKRAAAEILGRGESAIRFKPNSEAEISKAITRDDVRKLIADGSVFAIKAKKNMSRYGKELKEARTEGRRRGRGRRKGTEKARAGLGWEKKIRSQRKLLSVLKEMGKIDTKTFKRFYALAKGNAFADKSSLLLHLSDVGIKITEEEKKQIDEKIKSMYK